MNEMHCDNCFHKLENQYVSCCDCDKKFCIGCLTVAHEHPCTKYAITLTLKEVNKKEKK